MIIKQHDIRGVYEIIPKPIFDERGFFMRVYDEKLFADNGINFEWVQENHSRSEKKGIIRGLHFQFPPHTEAKMVRAVKGAVMDVFVDLRKDSETFGKWGKVELSEDNRKVLLIPRGFAHGFCTLTDISEIVYKVDNYYAPASEGGIAWNDTELGIVWPSEKPFLSKRDSALGTFKDFIKLHCGI